MAKDPRDEELDKYLPDDYDGGAWVLWLWSLVGIVAVAMAQFTPVGNEPSRFHEFQYETPAQYQEAQQVYEARWRDMSSPRDP